MKLITGNKIIHFRWIHFRRIHFRRN